MSTASGGFENLRVWQESMQLVEAVYGICANFPKEEVYGLSSQLKRAVISIPSNIAEGSARKSKKEFVQFVYIAKGSLAEVMTQIFLAEKLGFIAPPDQLLKSCRNLSMGLTNLVGSLSKS